MNQHPKQRIPLIQASCSDPFLRIEWQAFGALSSRVILLGIRIFHIPFKQVRQNPEAAALLARNLETMSPEMLEYKRLDGCRDQLVGLLKAGVTAS